MLSRVPQVDPIKPAVHFFESDQRGEHFIDVGCMIKARLSDLGVIPMPILVTDFIAFSERKDCLAGEADPLVAE